MLASSEGQSNLHDVEMDANSDADSGAVDTTVEEEEEEEEEGQQGIERQERGPQEG
jgi:hypothetical protein